MTDIVAAALITGLSVGIPSLAAQFVLYLNLAKVRKQTDRIETQTNNMNTELRQQRNAATTRADSAEGQLQGAKTEQDRANQKRKK